MESYANIAAANAPPPEQQPHPDPALLTTPSVLGGPPPDITGTTKVNIVPSNYGEPSTSTPSKPPGQASGSPSKDSESKRSETPTPWRWEKVKGVIRRPSIAGGLVGIVNIGLLAGGSYTFYTHPNLRRDTKMIASAAAATFALLGVESYAIGVCQNPPKKNATDRNNDEGSTAACVRRYVHEYVPRSGVIGGTTGVVNACILSIVGYLAYKNWNRPCWDRRSVSAASIGLLALLGCEMEYLHSRS